MRPDAWSSLLEGGDVVRYGRRDIISIWKPSLPDFRLSCDPPVSELIDGCWPIQEMISNGAIDCVPLSRRMTEEGGALP